LVHLVIPAEAAGSIDLLINRSESDLLVGQRSRSGG
jgi:hypothetical protein